MKKITILMILAFTLQSQSKNTVSKNLSLEFKTSTFYTSSSQNYFNSIPPENDECSEAVMLAINPILFCDAVTSGTTVSATASPQVDDVTGTPDNDVWFSFVATSTSHQIYIYDIEAVEGSSTDMGIGFYDGSAGCGSLSLLVDSDTEDLLVSDLNVGTTYYLRVYGFDSGSTSAQATFTICAAIPPPPPINDDLCEAIALTVGDAGVVGEYTSDDATIEANEPAGDCFEGGAQKTVWFSFVAPNSGDVTVSTDFGGTHVDTEISVYNGSSVTCSDLTSLGSSLGCDQDSGEVLAFLSTLSINTLTGGETYYIQVSGLNGIDGTFGLEVVDNATASNQDFFSLSNFSFYPNPVTNNFSIESSMQLDRVIIYNMLGQEIRLITAQSTQVDMNLSDVQAGVYLVKATIEGQTQTFKIIKK